MMTTAELSLQAFSSVQMPLLHSSRDKQGTHWRERNNEGVGNVFPLPHFFLHFYFTSHFPLFAPFILKEPLQKGEIKGHNPKHLPQLNALVVVGTLIIIMDNVHCCRFILLRKQHIWLGCQVKCNCSQYPPYPCCLLQGWRITILAIVLTS